MATPKLSRSILIGVIAGLVIGVLVGLAGAALGLPAAIRGGITGGAVVLVLWIFRTRIVGEAAQPDAG